MLTVKSITKNFGSLRAVDGVSLTVAQGDNWAIVGESGSGKSTLARLIVGLEKSNGGSIEGERSQIQMVFQDPYSSFDPMWTIEASLREAFCRKRYTPPEQLRRIKAMLVEVGLDETILSRYPHEFSGGQRQRLAIARALLAEPRLLILDEATSALDTLVARQILDLLKQIKSKFNLSYIFISHNLRLVKNFSDKIIIMRQGKVVEAGEVSVVFKKPMHAYTQQLMKAAFEYK